VTSIAQTDTPKTPLRGMWARMASAWLRSISAGSMTLRFPNGAVHVADSGASGPAAEIDFHRGAAIRKMLLRGDVGFAEAFMDRDWSTPDLQAVLDFAYANEEALAGPMRATALFGAALRMWHRLRANTRAGSRRNIAYHYDLGNAFYRLWLDDTMTYSSALFEREEMTIEEAQTEKYRRIVETLGIGADDEVLEIGCGWGGFAEFAAGTTGCKVVGVTLSKEQAAYARERMRNAGLADRVEIRIEDYRDVSQSFDKIVSIEMFEAVGEENWPVFFGAIRDRLRSGGRAGLQIITVAEERFQAYRRNVDFIRRYIFPGGMLPTKGIMKRQVEALGMRFSEVLSLRLSYAETLRRWHERFLDRWDDIVPLGFDERFRRMWELYLCGCVASFSSGATDVSQFLIERD